MKTINALTVIIALSLVFLFKEYREYNSLKKYKDTTSMKYKLCLSPEAHKKSLTVIRGSSDNLPPSCQEKVNKNFKTNIFRLIKGDELIFKY
ncbi:hypothetical protein N9B70_05410 [Candidatus Pelagibacter sp.]|mgnify:CR=1 FL=1|jgi:hypothetical protein|nr:hypothetical protein [Candidatus Pelagibacter sp.]